MSTESTDVPRAEVVKKAPRRSGFNEQGNPYPGVDPKTGERLTIVLDALIAEFDVAEGLAKYRAIASLEGEMLHPTTREPYTGLYFFNPKVEGAGYRPDLIVATLPEDARRQVTEILSTPQVKE